MNKQQLIDQVKEDFEDVVNVRLYHKDGSLTLYSHDDFIEDLSQQIESAYDKGREDAITKTQSLLFTENGFLKEEIDISDLLNETEKLKEKV